MAIMQRCCCFDNVRSGSTASAIYTLVYGTVALGLAAYVLSLSWALVFYDYGQANGFFIGCFIAVLLCVLILIASILVLVGVCQDQRGYLIPYMVVMPLLILLHAAYCIICIVGAATANYGYYYQDVATAAIAGAMVQLAISILFTVMDVICFLCVVSQYQELRDGRGRLQDVMTARTTVVTTTTQGFGGAVVVTQQGGFQQQPNPMQQYAMQQPWVPQQNYVPQQGFGYAPLQEDNDPAKHNPAQQQHPQVI